MSEWQPIETAPRDGQMILVTDGVRFAAAEPYNYYEPAEIGCYRPNPEAGKVRKLWNCIGCSAFNRNAELLDSDYHPWNIDEPTHWMPLRKPDET